MSNVILSLLECPFCGQMPMEVTLYPTYDEDDPHQDMTPQHGVQCTCGAYAPIEWWQKRAEKTKE